MEEEEFERSSSGFIVWHRKTLDSDIFVEKPAKWFKIWFYIVCAMSWKDSKRYPRGSNFMTYKEIMERTHCSYAQVKEFLVWAREENMLTTHQRKLGTVVSVINYTKYQDKRNNETNSETKAKRKLNESLTKPIEEPFNKGNNINNTIPNGIEPSAKHFGREDINWLLETFERIMGFKSSGSKDRFMASHLLRNFTREQLGALITYCATNQFAPRIGSVEKLWFKRGDIIAGIQKESVKSPSTVILRP